MLNNVEIPWRRKRHVKIEYDKNFYADKNLRGGVGRIFHHWHELSCPRRKYCTGKKEKNILKFHFFFGGFLSLNKL